MGLLPFEKNSREVFVKLDCSTDEKFGCRPENRSTEELINYGVICLNKPKGPTSHMCSAYVKKILKINSAGHGGSLDPGVTGVLPVATGRATRVVQALLTAGKEYVCIMHIHKPVPESELRAALNEFIGKVTQMPPVKSAVVRKERVREVYYLDILEIDGQDVLFRMGSQAGTYVRKICHDVGKRLGVGAHMAELIRTKAGPFNQDSWVSLQDLEDAFAFWKEENNDKFLRYCIKPVEFAVQHLPAVWVQDSAVDSLCHGASLNVPGVVKLNEFDKAARIAVFTLKDELIGLGDSVMTSKQILTEHKGLCVKVDKIFMLPGTYPGFKKEK